MTSPSLKPNKKIDKLNINLFPESTSENEYKKERAKYIADYTEYISGHSSGFFGWTDGKYVNNPAIGEAKWNKFYPGGYQDWAGKQRGLNAHGEQKLINKINEIIELVNNIKSHDK